MRRGGAAALLGVAALINGQGCAAITAIGATVAGGKSIYDAIGTAATDVDKIVAVSCLHYFNSRIGKTSELAAYGDSYCANPPTGSDPVESAIWLGELVGKMDQ